MINSVTGASEFERLRANGQYRRSGPLAVRVARAVEADDVASDTASGAAGSGNTGSGSTADGVQVAYAIGRQVGNAVKRNRLRRRLRAIMATRDQLGLMPAGTYLFIAKPAATSLSFNELQSHVERLIPVQV